MFGIEGKKLLTPDDDYDALKIFNQEYEGTQTPIERMHLEYQEIMNDNPGIIEKVMNYPSKVFSGRQTEIVNANKIFFCYSIPGLENTTKDENQNWTLEVGITKWYLYDVETKNIIDDPITIIDSIRSSHNTPRALKMAQVDLIAIRKTLDKYIKNTYLRSIQAPVGIKPRLAAWMELW